MGITKIFVGGPSQSGKSTLSHMIANATGLDHIDVDRDKIIIWLRRFQRTKIGKWLTLHRTLQILKKRAGPCVIDAPFIGPQWLRHRMDPDPQILVMFIGYPNTNVAEKMTLIRDNDFKYARHLKKCSVDEFEATIQYNKSLSETFQKQCKELEIAHFDVSDVSNLSATQSEIVSWVVGELNAQPNTAGNARAST